MLSGLLAQAASPTAIATMLMIAGNRRVPVGQKLLVSECTTRERPGGQDGGGVGAAGNAAAGLEQVTPVPRKLVQTDQSQIKAEDREYAAKIAEKIGALHSADGITSVEQCAVAVRLAGTKPENVVAGIKVVGNSWISLMGYQAKGYGYISP